MPPDVAIEILTTKQPEGLDVMRHTTTAQVLAQALSAAGVPRIFSYPGDPIIEFIERGKYGFCATNVAALMQSTKGD